MSKLLLGGVDAGEEAAKGVSFDGVSDYLSRSTDLVGNTDSKAFTFSCWVYNAKDAYSPQIYRSHVISGNSYGLVVILNSGERLQLLGRNSSGTVVLSAISNIDSVPLYTCNHLLVSIDMANTPNRGIYLNDIDITGSVTWTTYVNDAINHTVDEHYIASSSGGSSALKGRLSNVFLDYTYRDLSIEANRRLFITEDLKPADNQAALNPILYLPMDDADTAHINLGTGGDFTPNGVLDTAQRGANQWNCVASEFDGSNDYLRKTSGIAPTNDFSKMLISYTISTPEGAGQGYTFQHNDGFRDVTPNITLQNNIVDGVLLNVRDASGVTGILSAPSVIIKNRMTSIQLYVDLNNMGNSYTLIVDGEDKTNLMTFSGNQPTITVTSLDAFYINARDNQSSDTSINKAILGEVYVDYFDDANFNLTSLDNPFWDSELDEPKTIRQVLGETNNTPLIAMPLSADSVSRNLGTGSNFQVLGSPVGARGASEFWARSIKTTNNTTSYLSNATMNYDGLSTEYSIAFSIKNDAASAAVNCHIVDLTESGSDYLRVTFTGGSISVTWVVNGSIIALTSWTIPTDVVNGASLVMLAGLRMGSGPSIMWASTSFGESTTDSDGRTTEETITVGLTSAEITKGSYTTSVRHQGPTYVSTEFIDFSQEENRNLFVDQLGYPKDLQKQIDDGLIPTPLIYMPFDDPDYLGKNLGTGGDFQINGTVTQGADFSI